jgi:antitoxin (DNA-binding transcriptional repressor) of toxin-antitoxin stability system
MKTVEISAMDGLDKYAREAKKGPIILTEAKRPIAALVPIEDVDLESLATSTNPDFIALIERSRARMRAEGGMTMDEVRRELAVNRRKRKATRKGTKK